MKIGHPSTKMRRWLFCLVVAEIFSEHAYQEHQIIKIILFGQHVASTKMSKNDKLLDSCELRQLMETSPFLFLPFLLERLFVSIWYFDSQPSAADLLSFWKSSQLFMLSTKKCIKISRCFQNHDHFLVKLVLRDKNIY